MKLELITNFEVLESHREQWDRVAGEFPFFRWSWMGSWIRHMTTDLELAVLVAVDTKGDWMAIAPWCIDAGMAFSRRLRFLGSGETCSDYLDLICPEPVYADFSAAVVDWLIENIGNASTLGPIDVLELEGIAPESPKTKLFCEQLEASGFKQHVTGIEGGWRVALPNTWEEMNSTLSKSMRRKTKKAVQRLADDTTQVISTRERPLDELWPLFLELHQRRREMLGQSGCFADDRFECFLKSAVEGLIAESRAELICVFSEQKPVASMLLLNDDETTYMYQSGMDPDSLKSEPGYQIAVCSIGWAIDNHSKYFDFLRGDEPYKARWKTERISMVRARYIPRQPMAQFKHGIWLAGRSVKHWVSPMVAK